MINLWSSSMNVNSYYFFWITGHPLGQDSLEVVEHYQELLLIDPLGKLFSICLLTLLKWPKKKGNFRNRYARISSLILEDCYLWIIACTEDITLPTPYFLITSVINENIYRYNHIHHGRYSYYMKATQKRVLYLSSKLTGIDLTQDKFFPFLNSPLIHSEAASQISVTGIQGICNFENIRDYIPHKNPTQ